MHIYWGKCSKRHLSVSSRIYSHLAKVYYKLWSFINQLTYCPRLQSDKQILCYLLGASLEQIHIFALAHILRRPIIVYGIKFVKSFRGETIGLARFQGKKYSYQKVYLYTKYSCLYNWTAITISMTGVIIIKCPVLISG